MFIYIYIYSYISLYIYIYIYTSKTPVWRSGTEDPIQNCEKNPPGVELRYLGKKTTAGGRTRVTGKKGTRRGLNPGHWVHSGYTLGTRWVREGDFKMGDKEYE